ncbi:hypothetical protein SOJ_00560 [Staphylococcus sp. OJ82]|nr:hypothetical protein SOJ_00560 [Staphylococcus sp. OJ82]
MTKTENKDVLAYLSEAKSWQKQLERNENGNILKNYTNARIIFANDPDIKEMVARNSFTQRIEVFRLPNWRFEDETSQQWTDDDDSELRAYFSMEYGLKFNKEDLAEIVTRESRKNAYHPVKTFIESKDWDGVERVESVFIDYLGAEDSHYIRQVTRKWLIAGVTRIYEAGIKFDEMPVLYGKQGAGKSYIADRLAIGKWFKDDIDSFEGKDAKVGLQKAWIVEIAELSAMNKTVIEQTKKFLATRVDDFRPPYARQNIESPRHCVFIGTTNKYDFLKDTTGNRRFLPVAVDASKRIKSLFSDELNDEVVQQIWAEAYHYYKQDEGMKLDAEAEKVAAQTQESHTEDDPLVGEIEDFLNRPITEKYWDLDVYNKREMLYTELFSETLKKNKPYKRDRTCALEIYRVMMANLNSTPKQYETRKINQALDQLDICSKDSNAVQFGRGIGRQRGYTIKLD